jgi:hypothetical protein
MPIAAFEHRLAAFEKLGDKFIQRRHHLITFGDRKRPARTKVILHIYDKQCALTGIRHTPCSPSLLIARFYDEANATGEQALRQLQIDFSLGPRASCPP